MNTRYLGKSRHDITNYVTCKRFQHVKWNPTKEFRKFINEKKMTGWISQENVRMNILVLSRMQIVAIFHEQPQRQLRKNNPTTDWWFEGLLFVEKMNFTFDDGLYCGMALTFLCSSPGRTSRSYFARKMNQKKKKPLANSHGPWHNSVISWSSVHPLQLHPFWLSLRRSLALCKDCKPRPRSRRASGKYVSQVAFYSGRRYVSTL